MLKIIKIIILLKLFIVFAISPVLSEPENITIEDKPQDTKIISQTSGNIDMLIERIIEDNPFMLTPYDLEGGKIQLEMDFLARSYKDNPNNYYATPFILRIDTGSKTEFDILSDFLAYQNPNLGFNDVTLGFRWRFKEANPCLTAFFNVELPVGGAGFPTPEPEPGIALLFAHPLTQKFSLGGNILWSSQVASAEPNIRYNQWGSTLQFTYSANDNNQLSLGCVGLNPHALNGDFVTRSYLNYYYCPPGDFSYSATILKGMSGVDRDWQFTIGINHCWDPGN